MKVKRVILPVVLSVAMMLGLGACAQSGSNNTYTGKEPSDVYEITPGIVRTNYVTPEIMAKADMWANSDDTAVANVMKKADAGEEITIAVIGGSITQGTISSGASDSSVGSKKCYADIFKEWWELQYQNSGVKFVNAGIGGTDSYLGVHRVEKEVLAAKPDLVLVEFAVNDADNDFYQESYDNLIRKILKSESHPAVIMLIMGQTNGASAQTKEAAITNAYRIPTLSYYAAMSELMKSGTYTDKEMSGDEVHPSALGHGITGEILYHYLNEVYENRELYGDVQTFAEEPVTSEKYQEATILDSTSVTPDSLGTFSACKTTEYFPNGWQSTSGSGDITFSAEFKNLGILYQKTVDGLSGQFDVLVDGTACGTINANFKGGWGDAMEGAEVYTSDTKAKHTVTLHKRDDSTGDKLNLLGLMVS